MFMNLEDQQVQKKGQNNSPGSIVDSAYSSGRYFEQYDRFNKDAQFKAKCFLRLFLRCRDQIDSPIRSYVDVGCGTGEIVGKVTDLLNEAGVGLIKVKGYDVSPHVKNIKVKGIEFVHGDFCETSEIVDLVTLFDVFEHVPDPISFIKHVAGRCKIIGFHIPLDDSLNCAIRNLFSKKLHRPGHLIYLDSVFALNLLSLAGLRVIDYDYTFGFLAPSGHKTILSKIVFPFRFLMSKISPWLLSKTIGGASLMVIAKTPKEFASSKSGGLLDIE
jgi:SAM-dependent methyltransferase